MQSDIDIFKWLDSEEGRVRYSGSTRGWDESGHDTFSIEMDGRVYFGEARRSWLSDRKSYNVEVVSFGYCAKSEVGIPMDTNNPSISVFTKKELATARLLFIELVRSFTHASDKPSFLSEIGGAKFTGEVIFSEGWAIVEESQHGAAS